MMMTSEVMSKWHDEEGDLQMMMNAIVSLDWKK